MDNVVMLVSLVLSKRSSSPGLGKKKFPAQAPIRILSGEWGWLVSGCATLADSGSGWERGCAFGGCTHLEALKSPTPVLGSPLEVNRGVNGSPPGNPEPPRTPHRPLKRALSRRIQVPARLLLRFQTRKSLRKDRVRYRQRPPNHRISD